MNTSKRYRVARLSLDMLGPLLAGQIELVQVPADAWVSAMQVDLYYDGLLLKLHSASFEAVADGAPAQALDLGSRPRNPK